MKKQITFLILTFLSLIVVHAQQLNAYARVTSISGTTFSVSNVDEGDDTFEVGDRLIVMQMQDDVIGGNTNNNASFGNLGSIASAGLFEIRTISSITESSGIPTAITVSGALGNTYNTGNNSRVQLISFPQLGSPDYTTTGDLNAQSWNGNTGGVFAFEVTGTLTLEHNINLNNRGFRGGDVDNSASGGCDNGTFISANTNAFAGKGEGIYRNTNTSWEEAKGKILNGGGGGNEHNGGGGGGGNYTAGGNGGIGWNCTAPASAGGLGGIALSSHISSSRIFLGGGGGGGEGNNNVATSGARGGGIVIIRANELRTNGTCGRRIISANGQNSANAGNDGAGGAGAGGSILINVNSWDISNSCEIVVRANGGDAGFSNTGSVHGGGGGGGQGVVIYSIAQPTNNTTTQTQNGNGGCDNNSNPCNSITAGGGTGTNDTGIIDGATGGPLPIELDYFNAVKRSASVALEWRTYNEVNNDYFTVERSADGYEWEEVIRKKGNGTSLKPTIYNGFDYQPIIGTSYYRLKQTDFDGNFTYHSMHAINFAKSSVKNVYPNPTKGQIVVSQINNSSELKILNLLGKEMNVQITRSGDKAAINLERLDNGLYFLLIRNNDTQESIRIIKE